MKYWVLVSVIFLFSFSLFAQDNAVSNSVPRLIRYGGALANADGTPRTGVVGVMFSLYKEQEGSAALWTELQNVRPDLDGRYTVLLGSQHPEGVPAELFTTSEARWLGVQVEAEPEQARVLLVSVPYALKAGDAETLGGKPLSAFLMAPTAASADETKTSASKETRSTVVNAFAGTGTANYLARWLDDATVGASSLYDNGNVGIGTTDPRARLQIDGVVGEALRMTGNGTGPVAIRFKNDSGNDFYLGIEGSDGLRYFAGATSNSAVIYSLKQPIQYIVGYAPRLTIAANGNVGIGTTNPATRLEVSGGPLTISGAASPLAVRFVTSGDWNSKDFYIGTEGPTAGGYFAGSLPNSSVIYSVGGPIQYITRGTSRLVIEPFGNVGIGTTSPTSILTVAGTIESTAGGFKFPDSTIQMTALPNGCAIAQIPKWAGTSWMCQPDAGTVGTGGGTVTSITAGTGLTGGTITTSGTIALDTDYTDQRYTPVTAGVSNTAGGRSAMVANGSGERNTAFGFEALKYNVSGSGNTAIGYQAGATTGNDNIGTNNTFIGFRAGPGTSNPLTNATAIGAGAVVSSDNSLVLGSTNVKVGIGTPAPRKPLEVMSGDIYISSRGSGFILRTPDGSACLKITIDNTGTPVYTAVTCP